MSEQALGGILDDFVSMTLQCSVCGMKFYDLDGFTAAEIGWILRDDEPCCTECAKQRQAKQPPSVR